MHQPVRGNSQGGGTPRTATAVNSAVSQICLVTVTAYSHFIPETSGEVQVKINPLLDMASARPRRAKVKPGEEAAHFSSLCKDKDGFDVKFINSFKGRGVFSCRPFQNGDFLIEYRGEVITKSERENRQKVYHNALKVFMFDFRLNGQEFCVDAAKEDNSLGRLVNDDHISTEAETQHEDAAMTSESHCDGITQVSTEAETQHEDAAMTSESHCDGITQVSTEAETQHEDAAMTSESHCDGITQVSTEAETQHEDAAMTSESHCDGITQVSTEAETQHEDAAMTSESHCDGITQISTEAETQHEDAAMTSESHCDGITQISTEAETQHEDAAMTSESHCDGITQWIGVECKICSCFWHKSCYDQDSKMNLKTQQFDFKEPTSAEATSSEEEYYYRLPEATTQLAKISKLLLAMEKGSLKDLQGKTLEEIQIEDNLDLTDIGESEDSEAEEEDPAPHLKTNMGMETARRPVEEPPGTSDDIDSALEGPSKGMETARRPVEEPPGTSDDIHSALEGPSKALNTNADENDKEPGRRGDMHEPPESLEKTREEIEESTVNPQKRIRVPKIHHEEGVMEENNEGTSAEKDGLKKKTVCIRN
ncbi:hypothetical protein CesoFtcFv8_013291 [Champsocephalus esox]|uniref:SET domain-containing protein n=1 Tax=Champsocephalus esox TaxID=159716 RepID=A0AAN8BZA8_9TELE|nr:hypothetical protein CesoFtcFv8_013291 [Champsocephalus esox]